MAELGFPSGARLMPAPKFATQGALACAQQMETILNAMPRSRWTNSALDNRRPEDPAWVEGTRLLQRLILTEGGSFKDDWQGARVRLHGFTASSTGGLLAACRNWITQVRAKSVPPEGALT